MEGNNLSKEFKENITFSKELHLRKKKQSTDEPSKKEMEQRSQNPINNLRIYRHLFKRRFENPDSASCWLNSCLQLVLAAMDFEKQLVNTLFDSELGQELIHLHSISSIQSLDPSSVKEIITLAEDTRISTSLSEVGQQIVDRELLHRRAFKIENTRLNLRSGQQCVRDFFICLKENLVNWLGWIYLFSVLLR